MGFFSFEVSSKGESIGVMGSWKANKKRRGSLEAMEAVFEAGMQYVLLAGDPSLQQERLTIDASVFRALANINNITKARSTKRCLALCVCPGLITHSC